MTVVVGVLVLLLGLLAWVGQLLSAVSPALAAKLGLIEPPTELDAVFAADVRAEARWDAWMLWLVPAAMILMLAGVPHWEPVALVGGGMYLYFSGRGVLQRIEMQRKGVAIGPTTTIKFYYAVLGLWAAAGAATIAMALISR